MASSQRLAHAVNVVAKSSPTPYVCASCRYRASIPSRPSACRQQLRHNSELPFTEKLRRKIWGTDNPPGLKDPYGGPSFLERRLEQRKQEQQAQEVPSQSESVEAQAPQTYQSKYAPTVLDRADTQRLRVSNTEYREAQTWDGLEWVGHRGQYQFMEPKEVDNYVPWLTPSPDQRLTEAEVWNAIHESIFDAVQPADEAYDRDMAITITPEGYVTSSEEGATGDAEAFKTAKLGFKTPEAQTFKILKNFQKVTGIRLSDPSINKLCQNPDATFRDLVDLMLEAQAPKPLKTHENLVADDELMAQPNLKISARKVGPVDREKEIGRWKVIEHELKERGLPVFGRADNMKNSWEKKREAL